MTHIIPEDLKYTSSHEWVKNDSGDFLVGITEHAQNLLGDLVFVELPEVGHSFEKGQEMAVVESVKAASDVYAPISGKVIAVNTDLATQPELINKDPYKGGWLFKIKPSDANEVKELLDSEEYSKEIND